MRYLSKSILLMVFAVAIAHRTERPDQIAVGIRLAIDDLVREHLMRIVACGALAVIRASVGCRAACSRPGRQSASSPGSR